MPPRNQLSAGKSPVTPLDLVMKVVEKAGYKKFVFSVMRLDYTDNDAWKI